MITTGQTYRHHTNASTALVTARTQSRVLYTLTTADGLSNTRCGSSVESFQDMFPTLV